MKNHIRPTLYLCAIVGLWGAPARSDTYPRREGIDVLHYRFELTLGDESDRIAGRAGVEVRFVRDGVNEVALDLAGRSGEKGMAVSKVSERGRDLPFKHEADVLRIELDRPANAGERRGFVVEYAGAPAGGLRAGANRHGERTFFSVNWPDKARQWLPTVDHPYDKATSEFLVTAPAHYQVVANGLLQEERDLPGGMRLTHWKQSVPIATWLNAVGVARFAVRHAEPVNGVPLQTWLYPQDREGNVERFEAPARQAVAFFAERVGPYPYEKLANVQAAGLSGGTEHASAIFYGEDSVRGGRSLAGLVAHEVAHQWFGNSVTERDWDDVWLSEGFATYFALLFAEHYNGRDAFVAGLKRSRDTVLAAERRGPAVPVIHENLSDTRRVLNPLVYQKGAWVLHMLRGAVGTETFWRAIREYYRQYRDGGASTDDLRRVFEEASGTKLDWFFDQWLKRPGSPVVTGKWRYDVARKQIDLEIAQTQPGAPYRLPIEVGISGGPGQAFRVEKIELTGRTQRFSITAEQKPAAVDLDPGAWLLALVTLTADEH
jgi:aminopeptidase N